MSSPAQQQPNTSIATDFTQRFFRLCLLETAASKDCWIAAAFRSSSSCLSLSSLSSLFLRRLFWLATPASTILSSAAISSSRLLLLSLFSVVILKRMLHVDGVSYKSYKM
ncbi:hypothetical protein ONS96_012660 [Cadophora gregata f. sp. sojae]|nr:hypothetical protein ONS96_012660 [Cadophora gregata f. sp. sojae]